MSDQKVMLVKSNGDVVSKDVFAGNADKGILAAQLQYAKDNPDADLTFEVFDDSDDPSFATAIVTDDPTFVR